MRLQLPQFEPVNAGADHQQVRRGLENKTGRLNKRFVSLMGEGEMWRQQLDKTQQRDLEYVQAQIQLKETEQAREKAQGELPRMRTAVESSRARPPFVSVSACAQRKSAKRGKRACGYS